MRSVIIILTLACLAGCGSSDGNGEEIECMYGQEYVNQFDKSCQTVADCARVSLGLDCCGTSLYAGINKSLETEFNSGWSECQPTLEQCGCPAKQPHAEDGNLTSNYADIQLDCQSGSCTTFIN